MDIPLSERMLNALLVQMLRSEAIDPDDIADAAESLDKAGDQEAAHGLRCLLLEASASEPSGWHAYRARNRFRVIDGNGGKASD